MAVSRLLLCTIGAHVTGETRAASGALAALSSPPLRHTLNTLVRGAVPNLRYPNFVQNLRASTDVTFHKGEHFLYYQEDFQYYREDFLYYQEALSVLLGRLSVLPGSTFCTTRKHFLYYHEALSVIPGSIFPQTSLAIWGSYCLSKNYHCGSGFAVAA